MSKDLKRLSKSRVYRIADRQQQNCQSHFGVRLPYLLTAALVFVQRPNLSAAYLFISLTVYPDRIKKSENAALQQPWSLEISEGKKHGCPCPAVAPGYQILPLHSLASHLGSSAQVENCQKIRRQGEALYLPCRVGLHNFINDLLMNLISWGDMTYLLTKCHAGDRKQVLHLSADVIPPNSGGWLIVRWCVRGAGRNIPPNHLILASAVESCLPCRPRPAFCCMSLDI